MASSLLPSRALGLIVQEETGGITYYENRARHPVLPPGAQAGITIGVGYDLGQQNEATFRDEWHGYLDADTIDRLAHVIGLRGPAAKRVLSRLSEIDIPWQTAIDQFLAHSLPRYYGMTNRALPRFDELPGLCRGALVSLVYNRGSGGFRVPKQRDSKNLYGEMRAILAHMEAGDFASIPDELRSMQRLWKPDGALAKRRVKEAELFEEGLAELAPAVVAEDATDAEPQETHVPDAVASSLESDIAAAARSNSTGSPWLPNTSYPEIEDVQRRLRARGYDVGLIDGKWGSATSGAIEAYKTDRHLSGPAVIDHALTDDLRISEIEKWPRPVGEARRSADDATIAQYAPELGHAKQSRIGAFIAFVGSLLVAVFNGIVNFFGQAWEKVVGLQSSFGKVPMWTWLLVTAAVAGGLWWTAGQGEKTIRQAFKSGERL